MPTDFNFSRELKEVDMKTTSNTVSVETNEVVEPVEERFDTSKWMLAVTALLNEHTSKILKLERSSLILKIVVVLLSIAVAYRLV